jgi:hypothetical protein
MKSVVTVKMLVKSIITLVKAASLSRIAKPALVALPDRIS